MPRPATPFSTVRIRSASERDTTSRRVAISGARSPLRPSLPWHAPQLAAKSAGPSTTLPTTVVDGDCTCAKRRSLRTSALIVTPMQHSIRNITLRFILIAYDICDLRNAGLLRRYFTALALGRGPYRFAVFSHINRATHRYPIRNDAAEGPWN